MKRNNYIKIILIIFYIFNMGLMACSQNYQFEAIKNSKDYIWGFGQSEDYDIANKHALENLLSKISVHVESSFEYNYQQDGNTFKEYSRAVMNTYSNATLNGIEQFEYEKRGVYYILRYVKKNELEKMFVDRSTNINDYFQLGTAAQRENRLGDALRYYYWSYVLWLSHPYREDIKVDLDGSKMSIGLLAADRMNSIFSGLKFILVDKVVYDDKTKLILNCVFNGKKVINLDYRYNLGGNVSAMQEVNNGIAEVLLFGYEQKQIDKLRIGIEYKYLNKSYHDKDLAAVLNTVKVPFFKKSKKKIRLNRRVKEVNGNKPEKMIQPEYAVVNKIENSKSFYKKTVKQLLVDIENKDYKSVEKYFSAQSKDVFNKLIKNGNISVFPLNDTLKIVELNDVTMVRSVPMSFYFNNSKHQYIENVVFYFDKNNKISEISFALDNATIKSVLMHSKAFGNINDKYTLIRFIESYKTAYALKRLDYIKSIFSDDALIIVGTVLKRKGSVESMMKNIGESAIKYQRLTKREYVERLSSVFARNEYINIDFEDVNVKKLNGNEKIYGIQIAQNYTSSSYNDFGYLFLMIDLNDSLNPTIYVRTWQPEKNADGSIYGLEDFSMN